jgi:hypothetical protein
MVDNIARFRAEGSPAPEKRLGGAGVFYRWDLFVLILT